MDKMPKATHSGTWKFKKWVTSEILPSIRGTGSYSAPKTVPEQIQLLAQGNVEFNQRVDGLEERFNQFEQSLPLLPNESDEVSNAVKKRVVEVLGGKESPAYKNREKDGLIDSLFLFMKRLKNT